MRVCGVCVWGGGGGGVRGGGCVHARCVVLCLCISVVCDLTSDYGFWWTAGWTDRQTSAKRRDKRTDMSTVLTFPKEPWPKSLMFLKIRSGAGGMSLF